MTASGITVLRRANRFLRATALLVCVAFTMLILTPTVVAAQQLADEPATATLDSSDEAKFARALERLERRLEKLEERLNRRLDAALEVEDVKKLKRRLERLDAQLVKNFDKVRRFIERKQLPEEILARHEAMVATYQAELDRLIGVLTDVETITDETERLNAVKAALTQLRENQQKRPQQPFDPENLPFTTPTGEVRAPSEDLSQLQALLSEAPTGAKTLTTQAATTSVAPQPEDLAPTEDVQITPEIQALAQSLNNNPVEIYNWVHNNIEFIPTYGSIQGSQLTLETRRGNAFDTTSLLIALLRAADIPARYVYGTVQIPVEQVMNWVGGVNTPQAAMELLGQGGIPNTGLAQGGVIKFIKLEHIWVEAWVDFEPSRGALNREGDSWVPLDGSFKQYDITGDPQFLQDAFDGQQLLDTMLSFTNINEANHWFSSTISLTKIIELVQQQEQIFSDYYELKLEEEDPLQNKVVIPSERPIMSAGLPYRLVQRGSVFAELPAQFQHKFRYQLFSDNNSYLAQSPTLSFEDELVSLAGKKIGLRFVPSTPADEAALLSFLPETAPGAMLSPGDLPTSIPGYLISLTAQFVVDGEVVQQQAGFTMGETIIASPAITKLTGGWFEAKNEITAGEYHALAISLQGFSNSQLNKNPNPSTDSLLHQAGIALLEGSDMFLGFINDMNLGHAVRHPSFGSVSTGLRTQFSFFVPRQVEFVESRVDLDYMALSLVSNDSDSERRKQLNEAIGLSISMLEDQIPSYYLASSEYPGEGISATKALAHALITGQKVYSIDSSNISTVLPLLSHDSAVLADIRNGINAGLEVTVHERPVQISAWSGTGYMLVDPNTGSGAYRISGGYNGGGAVTELNPALAYLGISIALPIIIPTMLADEGDCGAKDKIQSPNWSWLIFLAIFLLIIFLLAGSGGALAPAIAKGFVALLGLFTTLQAQAQEGCKVYISAYQSKRHTVTTPKLMYEATQHISEAFNNPLIPKLLTHSGRQSEYNDWYSRPQYDTPCLGNVTSESGKSCDEYPFLSTLEGGPVSWIAGRVSVKLIEKGHNDVQGGTVGGFNIKCRLYKNETFEVQVDLQIGSVTRGLDENGNQCY